MYASYHFGLVFNTRDRWLLNASTTAFVCAQNVLLSTVWLNRWNRWCCRITSRKATGIIGATQAISRGSINSASNLSEFSIAAIQSYLWKFFIVSDSVRFWPVFSILLICALLLCATVSCTAKSLVTRHLLNGFLPQLSSFLGWTWRWRWHIIVELFNAVQKLRVELWSLLIENLAILLSIFLRAASWLV
jgi:hypothetical protein